LTPNLLKVVQELYLSARGSFIFIDGTSGLDMWNLKIAPYPLPWGTTWTNEEYIRHLRRYIEDVLAVEGWGVELWHNLTNDPNEPSSAAAANETEFRTHLAELTSDYEHRLWIAPLHLKNRLPLYRYARSGLYHRAVNIQRLLSEHLGEDLRFIWIMKCRLLN
jgi:hypothetical protein